MRGDWKDQARQFEDLDRAALERIREDKASDFRDRLTRLLGELAGPATTVSFLAAEDPAGDAVRWSDVERIFASAMKDS